MLEGPQESCGVAPQWALGPSDAFGPFPPTAFPCESGPSHLRLSLDDGRASKKLIGGAGLGVRGPVSSLVFNADDAHLRGARPLNGAGPSSVEGLDQSWSFLLVTDGLWRPSAEEQSLEENSKTNDALMEEALRYGNASNFFGPLVCVSPSPPSSFSGRTPPGEYYDRSGVVLDASQRDFMDRRMIGRMPIVMKTVDCRETSDDNNGVMGSSGKDLCLVGETVPEIRDWREAS